MTCKNTPWQQNSRRGQCFHAPVQVIFFLISVIKPLAQGTGGSEVIGLGYEGINNRAEDKHWDQKGYYLSFSQINGVKCYLNRNNASNEIYITKAYLITEVIIIKHHLAFGIVA